MKLIVGGRCRAYDPATVASLFSLQAQAEKEVLTLYLQAEVDLVTCFDCLQTRVVINSKRSHWSRRRRDKIVL